MPKNKKPSLDEHIEIARDLRNFYAAFDKLISHDDAFYTTEVNTMRQEQRRMFGNIKSRLDDLLHASYPDLPEIWLKLYYGSMQEFEHLVRYHDITTNGELFLSDDAYAVDSMLIDSGYEIASLTYHVDGKYPGPSIYKATVETVGTTAVIYKGTRYDKPSEFPDELKKRIRRTKGKCLYRNNKDIELLYNNWFEVYLYVDDDLLSDPSILEDLPANEKEYRELLGETINECVEVYIDTDQKS